MKLIDLELVDKCYEPFAIYERVKIEQYDGASVCFINGAKVVFMIDMAHNVFCKVSYSFGEIFGEMEQWNLPKFMDYLKRLRAMTKEEVAKR